MKFVRDRADGRWLPSRYRFAIFRLAAWLRFRNAARTVEPGLVLAIDRDQTAGEHYIVAGWFLGSAAMMTAAVLEPFINLWGAVPLGIILTVIAVQAMVALLGVGPRAWRERAHVEFQSFVHMFLLALAALYFAGASSWVRHVARSVLIVMAANAAAAVIVFLLRDAIEAAEREVTCS